MASKHWHMRSSWALDGLAVRMARELGYPNKTALLKSMIRGCALIGKNGDHTVMLRIARESPAVQDRIDADLAKRWVAAEFLTDGVMKKMAAKAANGKVRAEAVLDCVADDLIGKAR